MVTTFFLILAILIIVGTLNVIWINRSDYDDRFPVLTFIILCMFGIIFVMGAGLGGGFGCYKATEIDTKEFSKALANDHNSVTVVYKGKPYLFTDYKVVNGYDSIENIHVYYTTSVFGVQNDFALTVNGAPCVNPTP